MAFNLQRSTKGASKQRRDNINSEVSIIRSLLPLSEAVKSRLSQLQVMSMCKAFVGKCNLLSTLTNGKSDLLSQVWEFSQALPGFMLVTDSVGNIVYLTDNSVEYLSHSMVDIVSQCENISGLLHPDDKHHFTDVLQADVRDFRASCTFSCRMGLMKHPRRSHAFDKYKRMKVNASMVKAEGGSFKYLVALCTPHLNSVMASEHQHLFDTFIFKSMHSLDMKIASLDDNGQFHLGYSAHQAAGLSWYSILHPDDVQEAVRKHSELLKTNFLDFSVSMTCRLQRSDGEMVWLRVVMRKEMLEERREERIVCCNHVMQSEEVLCKTKLPVTVTSDSTQNGCDVERDQGKKNKAGKEVEGLCVSKENKQDPKKTERRKLIEKLKKKMKKNDGSADGVMLDNTAGPWSVEVKSVKNETNKFSNVSALPPADHAGHFALQGYEVFKQTNFLSPSGNQFSGDNQASMQTFKQEKEVEDTAFLMDASFQQPLNLHQAFPASTLNSDLIMLQETLFNNAFHINNSKTNNSTILNYTINCSSLDLSHKNNSNNNTNFANNIKLPNNTNNFPNNNSSFLNNNNNINNNSSFLNNNNNFPNNNAYSFLDSGTASTPSYASSPYSACSPPNSEDLNNQSFFAQADEIKCEFTFKEDFPMDEAYNLKSHPLVTPKNSFPELEAQEVDDYLKLLEEPMPIDSEFDEPSFFSMPLNPFSQNPMLQYSTEKSLNFSNDFF